MRLLGVDDGYFPPWFKSKRGYTLLVGVVYNNGRLESIMYDKVLVDGESTTELIISYAKQCCKVEALILDGVTYAGFDVVDIFRIWRETGTPVIVVQQYKLDLGKIRRALERNFLDYERRFRIIEEAVKLMKPYRTMWKTILIANLGLDNSSTIDLLEKNMIYSPIPEPLRYAHQIASAISKRISYKLISGPAGI